MVITAQAIRQSDNLNTCNIESHYYPFFTFPPLSIQLLVRFHSRYVYYLHCNFVRRWQIQWKQCPLHQSSDKLKLSLHNSRIRRWNFAFDKKLKVHFERFYDIKGNEICHLLPISSISTTHHGLSSFDLPICWYFVAILPLHQQPTPDSIMVHICACIYLSQCSLLARFFACHQIIQQGGWWQNLFS